MSVHVDPPFFFFGAFQYQASLGGFDVLTDFLGVEAQSDLLWHRYDQTHEETIHLDMQ